MRATLFLDFDGVLHADREDAVPDAVWDEAKRHFDDKGLAGLVLAIAQINLNVEGRGHSVSIPPCS